MVYMRLIRRCNDRRGVGGVGGWGGEGGGLLTKWEDNLENAILGAEPNAPLDYSLVLEIHHPIISMSGGNGGKLD